MNAIFHVVLYLLYLTFFMWAIFKWSFFEVEGANKKHFVFFFLLKVVAGISLTLVYTYYYTDQQKADIYRYFNDSKIISSILFTDPVAWFKIMSGYGIGEQDVFKYLLSTQYFSHPGSDIVTNNTFIIRVNVLLNYLSFSNIYINTLFLNFISFIGLTALYKVLRNYFSGFQQILYVPLFLLPSVLFWSSGLLKESLLFTGIGFYLYAWLNHELAVFKRVALILVALLLLFFVKIQVAGILLLCSLLLPSKKFTFSFSMRLIILFVLVLTGSYFLGNHVSELLIEKRNEFVELALKENAGSYFDTNVIEPSVANLLKLLPEAFINSVLRPFVWDGGKVFQKVFAVENLFFLFLLINPLRFFKLPKGEKLMLCIFFLLFALFNYIVIGITVPIMGAIVHYRVIAEPFLLLAVMLCVDLERLKQSVSRFGIS